MKRQLLMSFILALLTASLVVAQTGGGQVCVRAFEDRNGNGQQDNNEPFITRGISATLANEQGIILNTALIEDSPNAANGTLCFQRLVAGQYAVRLASADYNATTSSEFVTAVSETGLPQVFPFGGQIIATQQVVAPEVDEAAEQEARLMRLVLAGAGGGIAILVMAFLGLLVYLIFLRGRSKAAAAYAPAHATGTYPAARPATGSYPEVRPATGTYPAARPATGSYPAVPAAPQQPVYDLYEDDDTSKFRPVVEPIVPPAAPVDHLPYDSADDFRFEDDEEDSPFRPPRD